MSRWLPRKPNNGRFRERQKDWHERSRVGKSSGRLAPAEGTGAGQRLLSDNKKSVAWMNSSNGTARTAARLHQSHAVNARRGALSSSNRETVFKLEGLSNIVP